MRERTFVMLLDALWAFLEVKITLLLMNSWVSIGLVMLRFFDCATSMGLLELETINAWVADMVDIELLIPW
jgi:hypothetical protein